MYLELKYHLFSLIPGAGLANIIYLGIIVWMLAIYLSNRRWGAFTITLIVGLVFKGIDMFFYNQPEAQIIHEFVHFMILPLLLTLLNPRISRLG